MTAMMINNLDFASLRQLLDLVGWAMPALKIGVVLLVVLWLVFFWCGEILDATRKRRRRTPPREND